MSTAQKMSEDRRRFPRIPLDVSVNYDYSAIAHSKDISEGGICLITEKALDEGKMLHLAFSLPERKRPIECFGKVMWSRKAIKYLYQSGVHFWDIKEREQAEIKKILAH